MRFAGYELRERERQLIGPGGPVQLSGRSFDILTLLLANPNEIVDKTTIFDAVWPGVVVGENTLQVHISSLRKLLGTELIATVHGRGYKYVGPLPDRSPTVRAVHAGVEGNAQNFRSDCIRRDAEIAAVSALLDEHRLVSIVGPGGVGKTTLAVEVAARRAEQGAGGAWVVDLAPIADPQHMLPAIIATFGLQPSTSLPAIEILVQHIQSQDGLVVLDNCEHVLEAAATVSSAVLQRAPRMRVLSTSQIPLGVGLEHIYKLHPFGTADDTAKDPSSASVAFFRHCYEALGERIEDAELPVVARLCESLSGVALALKMAAARAAALGISEVARQIEAELTSLAAPWSTGLPRHRSLTAALSWSYGLLSERERQVFRSLGVFNGGFSLDGATAVGGDREIILELLRKSLLVREPGSASRYRLLESARHFALEHLKRENELGEASARHARHMTDLLARSVAQWEDMPDRDWLLLYQREMENLRAAVSWLGEQRQSIALADLCAVAWRLWLEAGYGEEGLAQCRAALEACNGADVPGLSAELRLGATELCRATAQDTLGAELIAEAVQHFRRAGDTRKLAHALSMTIRVWQVKADTAISHAAAAELSTLVRNIEDSKLNGNLLTALALDLIKSGQIEDGLARGEAGIAMLWAKGSTRSALRSGMFIGEWVFLAGNPRKAATIVRDLLLRGREPRFRIECGVLLANLASYHIALAEFDVARELILEAAEYLTRRTRFWYIALIQCAAAIEAETGDAIRAARILGYTDQVYATFTEGRQVNETNQRAAIIARLKSVLSVAELEKALEDGNMLSPFEADILAGIPVLETAG